MKLKQYIGRHRTNLVTYGVVILGFVIMQVLSASHMLSSSVEGFLVPICAYVVLAVSLNLVVGISGELSLGHAGFMGVGAFTGIIVAALLKTVIASKVLLLIVAIVCGGVMAGLFGVVIGLPVMRLRGDYLAIMGPSGSGKTTLMNIIGCLDVPTSGTYELDGQNLKDMDDDELADIRNKHLGFVFQSFYLMPKLTALDNVALPLLYAGVSLKERRERAAEALKAVGLEERMDFFPNQLSGGQCQRVAIARAMVGKPDLLLADEPTGALDTKAGNQIMDIFRRLSDEGMTILMITHELAIAQCADKIYHILDGQLRTYDEQQEGGAGNEEAE